MNFKSVLPDNKDHWLSLRTKVITSTEVSALFGMSPYQTAFELWHRKRSGDSVVIEENERMKWGTYLQPSIAAGIAKDRGWEIREKSEFVYSDDRIGSSFDYEITSEQALLEIKNVDSMVYYKTWKPEEAPPHIELQVQHQLLCAGLKTAYIGALVGGNELILLKRAASKNLQEMITSKVAAFWKSVEENNPPSPNFQKDAEFIISLHNYANPNTVLVADDMSEVTKFCNEYKDVQAQIKTLEEKKEILKAKILQEIKDFEKVKGSNYTISAGIVAEADISFKRKAFRNFKVTFKKGAENE